MKRRTPKPVVPVNIVVKLLEAVAYEAHVMGRIYAKNGEEANPADEFSRVLDMAHRHLRAVRPKRKRK